MQLTFGDAEGLGKRKRTRSGILLAGRRCRASSDRAALSYWWQS